MVSSRTAAACSSPPGCTSALFFGGGLFLSCWLLSGVLSLRDGLVEDGGCLFVFAGAFWVVACSRARLHSGVLFFGDGLVDEAAACSSSSGCSGSCSSAMVSSRTAAASSSSSGCSSVSCSSAVASSDRLPVRRRQAVRGVVPPRWSRRRTAAACSSSSGCSSELFLGGGFFLIGCLFSSTAAPVSCSSAMVSSMSGCLFVVDRLLLDLVLSGWLLLGGLFLDGEGRCFGEGLLGGGLLLIDGFRGPLRSVVPGQEVNSCRSIETGRT